MLRQCLAASFALLMAFSAEAQEADEVVMLNEIHIHQHPPRIDDWLLSTLTAPEFGAVAVAACAAFGVDCSDNVEQIKKTVESIKQYTDPADASFVQISTPYVNHVPGQIEWTGYFGGPPGYVICDARIDWGGAGVSAGTSFGAEVRKDLQGIGFSAPVPRPAGLGAAGEGLDARMAMKFVKPELEAAKECLPDRAIVWDCKGHGDCALARQF
jgi:hypothetical protein